LEEALMSNKVKELNILLADYHVQYQTLRNYHWNVTGGDFFTLHIKFEEMYTEVAGWIDEIAESILAQGEKPISTLKDYLATSSLKEGDGSLSSKEMVEHLISNLEALNKKIQSIEDGLDHKKTQNILDAIEEAQQMSIWMLKAFLNK
jgi:starvation-inducible DNA-binding protein